MAIRFLTVLQETCALAVMATLSRTAGERISRKSLRMTSTTSAWGTLPWTAASRTGGQPGKDAVVVGKQGCGTASCPVAGNGEALVEG